MTDALVFALPANENMAENLAKRLDAELGQLATRSFPDGEAYLCYDTHVAGRKVILVCTLDRPDPKVLPLLFAAAAARELGALEVGLVAPYLCYMRQDRRFRPGEAVTSTYFAQTLSPWIDWLVTVDPHLHRRGSLSEIYSVPSIVLHASPLIADWIRREVASPLLVGPDEESEQWVADVASRADAPHIVLRKVRHGDRDVEISVPDVDRWRERTPVLVDDIISTARTMIETLSHLRRAGMPGAVCIGVHGLFAEESDKALLAAGAARVITTNTLAHASNAIDVGGLLADGVGRLWAVS